MHSHLPAPASAPSLRHAAQGDDLLLRETTHRCQNDLQLIVSMLALQGSRATVPAVRQALEDARERVAILARARSAMHREQHQRLECALRQVCEALCPQAEPRAIVISLVSKCEAPALPERRVTTIALVVNELVTNAIKHAFADKGGQISVTIDRNGDGGAVIVVDDDGLPLGRSVTGGNGLGMSLAKRLMASVDGLFIPPTNGSKAFELRMTV